MAILIHIRDMGCYQTLMPVYHNLKENGIHPRILIDKGGMAYKKHEQDFVRLGWSCFTLTEESILNQQDDVLVTCLPTELCFDAVVRNKGKLGGIVLVQEVPEGADPRTRTAKWLSLHPSMVCVLHENFDPYPWDVDVVETGLPGVDAIARNVDNIAVTVASLMKKYGLERKSPVLASLPGDKRGCERFLQVFETDSRANVVIIPRFHPKFRENDPEGYEEICRRLYSLGYEVMSAEKAAEMPIEHFYAIAREGVFMAPHDSTMLQQASAAAVTDIRIPAPWSDHEYRVKAGGSPFVERGYGLVAATMSEVLAVDLGTKFRGVMADGNAVENIADEILAVAKIKEAA